MTASTVSKFSCKSCASFGIRKFNSSHQLKNNTCSFGKFPISLGIVMFSFVVSMLGLLIVDITTASTNHPSNEIKRFIKADDVNALKQISHAETSDVTLIPENDGNRRMSEHPNHRYTQMEPQDKIYNDIRGDLYAATGWFPKSFHPKTDKTKHGGWKKFITSTRKPEYTTKKEISRNMGPPVRLKGKYIQPEKEEENDQKIDYSENYYNLKEINDLMLSNSDVDEEEVLFPTRGRPFQLPKKRPESFKKYSSYSPEKNYNSVPKIQKTKGKPITILLDIYPMTDATHQNPGEILKTKFLSDKKSRKGMRFRGKRPRSFDPVYSSSNNIPFRVEKGNRMIIKLNLFQKKKNSQPNFNFEDSDYSTRRKRAEERTFSLFSKHKKKKHSKKCSVVEVYAHETPYVAKWKGKDGEWIYTKHVDVKHFEKE